MQIGHTSKFILEIFILALLVAILFYVGYIALENTKEEIETYCNKYPNSTITGDVTIECSEIYIAKTHPLISTGNLK